MVQGSRERRYQHWASFSFQFFHIIIYFMIYQNTYSWFVIWFFFYGRNVSLILPYAPLFLQNHISIWTASFSIAQYPIIPENKKRLDRIDNNPILYVCIGLNLFSVENATVSKLIANYGMLGRSVVRKSQMYQKYW